jgi:heat shock protein HslJ
MKILFSLFALIMMTESCNSTQETIDVSAKNGETLSGTYSISQIGDSNSISKELSISFEDSTNKVFGFAGCNTFFGTYSEENRSIIFNDIATTKIYCQKEINNLESQFMAVLNSANTLSINENIISLLENETVLLTAIKSDPVKAHYNAKITYQAISRGSFEYIQISESEVLVSMDRNLINTTTYKCNEDDWEALNKMLKEVNTKAFQKLKAPTDKRSLDGAAHATLAIKKKDGEITTPPFDHGSPPEAIETLVNKVLSIKENAIKKS